MASVAILPINYIVSFAAMAETSNTSAQNFVKEQVYLVALKTELFLTLFFMMLPLHHGPTIRIRVKASNAEITISTDLLCAETPVFTRMFNNGHFKESQEQALGLEEMDDHLNPCSRSSSSIAIPGIIKFDIESPKENISAAMELVRFADMYEIDGLEAEMAKYIEEILVSANIPSDYYGIEHNTYFLKPNHIISALNLPVTMFYDETSWCII
jgi:hypothetical protein